MNNSITLKSFLGAHCNPSTCPPCHPHWQATSNPLPISIDEFALSRHLYKWNHKNSYKFLPGFFSLAPLFWDMTSLLHCVSCIPLCGHTIICAFTCLWTLGYIQMENTRNKDVTNICVQIPFLKYTNFILDKYLRVEYGL